MEREKWEIMILWFASLTVEYFVEFLFPSTYKRGVNELSFILNSLPYNEMMTLRSFFGRTLTVTFLDLS